MHSITNIIMKYLMIFIILNPIIQVIILLSLRYLFQFGIILCDNIISFTYDDTYNDKPIQILSNINNYTITQYSTITHDGFVLNIHRIRNKGNPVLLVHTMYTSSFVWLDSRIAYKLHDKGYDVWLYNMRGNEFSNINVNNLNSQQYWNYSWHEGAKYDLKQTIDLVYNKTNKRIKLLSHSMGSTIIVAYLSLYGYDNRLDKIICMAPPVNFKNSSLNKYATILYSILSIFENNGLTKFDKTAFILCKLNTKLCLNIWKYFNEGYNDLDELYFDDIMSHYPSGTSVNTALHYLQIIQTNNFTSFNRGYGVEIYDLSKIKNKILFLLSYQDYLVNHIDTIDVCNKIQKCFYHIFSNVSHTDFIFAKHNKALIINQIFNYFEN